MKFLSDIEVEEGLKDSDGSSGSNGQLLSSANNGTATEWIDAPSGTIGCSIADNQIAVGASTANNIEGSDNFRLIPLTLGSVSAGDLSLQGRLVMSDKLVEGSANLFIGKGAGSTSWSGINIGIGAQTLRVSAGGELNCALGYSALRNSTLGDENTALGHNSLYYLTGSGQDYNTAIGTNAARYYSTGTDFLTQSSQGVYLGGDTRASANNISNEIAIGYGAVGGGSDTITLGNSSVDLLRIPGLGSTNGHVLTYSTADGGIVLAAGGSGGGIGGSITAGQVAFGDTTNDEITGSSALTFTSSNTLKIDNGGSTGSTPNLVLNKGAFGVSKILMQDAGTTKLQIECNNSNDSSVTAEGRLTLKAGGASPHVIMSSASNAKVGIGVTLPKSKLQVAGGVQIGDDSDTASADKVGTFKYHFDNPAGIFDYSYVDMCMQTDTNTYEWVNIVTNRWER